MPMQRKGVYGYETIGRWHRRRMPSLFFPYYRSLLTSDDSQVRHDDRQDKRLLQQCGYACTNMTILVAYEASDNVLDFFSPAYFIFMLTPPLAIASDSLVVDPALPPLHLTLPFSCLPCLIILAEAPRVRQEPKPLSRADYRHLAEHAGAEARVDCQKSLQTKDKPLRETH